MRPAPLETWSAARGGPDRHRAASFMLVAALHLLLLLLLLRLAPPAETPPKHFVPMTVDLSPEVETPAQTKSAAAPSARARVAPPEEVPPPPVVHVDAEEAPVSSAWSQVIPLTRQEMAQADIGKIPSRPAAPAGEGEGESGTTSGMATDDSSGVGKGPNGQTLYNARWYREPTNAELSTYLPPGRFPDGWGIIACQTVADYRVDNCEEIAQSPAGSGLAGAVRKAAWQFRVMPPRIGGKRMVGSWVRIRIDYNVEGAK